MDEMLCNKGCGVGFGNGKCCWWFGDERGYFWKFFICVFDLIMCIDYMCDDWEFFDIFICL